MAWWVKECVLQDADDNKVLKIQCDTVSDLPAYNYSQDFTICRGSEAEVIADGGERYILNSQNQWIKQKTGQEIEIDADSIIYDNTDSGLTATTVQDAIDELKDENNTQDTALTELYSEDANLQLQITYAIDTGVKNIFETTATDYSTRNCDFTVNSDGSFGVHTTAATDAASNTFMIGSFTPKETAQYVITTGLSSTATGGDSSTTFCLQLRTGDGSAQGSLVSRVAQTWTGTLEANTTYHLRFYFASGQTISEVCQPMVKKAIIKSSSWEPYAPTNRELYEKKITLNDVFGYGKLIPDSANLNDYTIGGKYYGGNSAGTTVSNLPVANDSFTFTLEVKQATPNMTYQYLRICRLADDPYIYVRRKYSTWGSWYRFTGEAISAQVQSVNPLSPLNLSNDELNLRSEDLDTNFELLEGLDEGDDLDV